MNAETRDEERGKDREAKAQGAVAKAERAAKARVERSWTARLSENAWMLIPLLVPVAIVVGMVQGAGAAFLVLIAAALVAVIALFWSSVRTLLGETPLSGADAYALAAPRAEEEQKQAVLRALKDLEFERSVGKISDDDYAALVAKYRAEAKRLLRVLDEQAKPRRDRVEGLVHARLVEAGLESPATHRSTAAAPEEPAADAKPRKKKKKAAEKATGEAPARAVEIEPLEAPEKPRANVDTTWKSAAVTLKTQESPTYAPPTKKCAECQTRNDADAVFCKKCGSKAFEGGSKVVTQVETKGAADDARKDDTDQAQAAAEAADGGDQTDAGEKAGAGEARQ